MMSSPPPESLGVGLRRRLKLRSRARGAVIDGESRFVAERPEPADPVVFLYDLYERTAVPIGIACVALGLLFGTIAVLLTGTAVAHS